MTFGVPKNPDQTFWNPIIQQDNDHKKPIPTQRESLFIEKTIPDFGGRDRHEEAKFAYELEREKRHKNGLNNNDKVSDRARNYILNYEFPRIMHGYFEALSDLI